jgi:ABC transport system ATP-binding/permease protein
MKVGRLTIIAGTQSGRRTFTLEDLSVFEIGRAAGNHVRLQDESLAMNQCRIFRRGEEFTLYALSDSRPTLVNGQEVNKVVLQGGDHLSLGQCELVFEIVEPAQEAAPELSAVPPAASTPPGPPVAPSAPPRAAAASSAAPPAPPADSVPAPEPVVPAKTPPKETVERPVGNLTVVEGENHAQVYPLAGKDSFKIGRSALCDIRLPDAKVSRVHCLIERFGSQYVIVDLESANGTIVNGERMRKAVLRNNDFLRLGFTLLKFEETREHCPVPGQAPA